jgi:hypothetical protein
MVGRMSLRIIIITILIPFSVSGQEQIVRVIKHIDELEISAGPSSVTLLNKWINSDNRELKVAYTLRLASTFNINDRLSFISTLYFERKGYKIEYQTWYNDSSIDFDNCMCTESLGKVEMDTNIDYITFSPQIRLKLLSNRLHFSTGPYVSYLTKYLHRRTDKWDGATYVSKDHNFKNYDLGLSLSIGYKIELSDTYTLDLILMDNLGLLNIEEMYKNETVTKTNSLSFQVGINYKLKNKY